ncbi:alpha/beta fold hydrolase [Marivibrio halodurans]|uniref:Alpha/beta fold hydrolase n=1 Tax=Marivibrio halodurans TaxID=2039722 RepID=A0A8J7S275_9PROT|nr:alpha/beta fold hydrolase [Marivibrio halodurans]MBP5858920.1 alpha/beta fold hydrolase [Marivibrio halodurans]
MEPRLNGVMAVIAVLAIAFALTRLSADWIGVESEALVIDDTPATLYRPSEGRAGPPVVLAHGFGGSQQMMRSLALTLARNGYTAITYDFPGHGRHPAVFGGDIRDADMSGRVLLDQLDQIAARASRMGEGGPIALVGHAMAADLVTRYARAHPGRVAATVALSTVPAGVDGNGDGKAGGPRNLLIVMGAWEEERVLAEALRAVSPAVPPTGPGDMLMTGRTYGDVAAGTGRRAAVVDGVEHVGVLFARATMEEVARWLDAAFARTDATGDDGQVETVRRGPWIALLLAGLVLLARPLASRLPALGGERLGANLSWRQFAGAGLVPAVATPPLLAVLPTDFMTLRLGDYLALHFLVYGLFIAGALYWLRRRRAEPRPVRPIPSLQLLAVALAVLLYLFLAVVLPVDRLVTNLLPGEARVPLILALVTGTLVHGAADEWLTRGGDAPRGLYWFSKLLFLVSLAVAIALAPGERAQLAVLFPALLALFMLLGLVSRWCYLRTHHPIPAGLAGGVLSGWVLGTLFPIITG